MNAKLEQIIAGWLNEQELDYTAKPAVSGEEISNEAIEYHVEVGKITNVVGPLKSVTVLFHTSAPCLATTPEDFAAAVSDLRAAISDLSGLESALTENDFTYGGTHIRGEEETRADERWISTIEVLLGVQASS